MNSRKLNPNKTLARGLAASLLVTACVTLPACKPATDADNRARPATKRAQEAPPQARTEAALVQQAAENCRQRIQKVAAAHAANARALQEAKVLDMEAVKQREQLEAKRAVVRTFLMSNEALRLLLVKSEAAFKEELTKLNLPPARIAAATSDLQIGIRGKAEAIQMREADQRMGSSLLGALDFLDEIWGQWNYNKEYDHVQFSPPGALKKYNDFMEVIEAASKEQQALQEQLRAAGNNQP